MLGTAKMKYQKEIDSLVRELIYDSWMNEDDYKEVEKECMSKMPNLKEQLSKDLETGINNGHSLEYQLELSRKVLKALKSSA